MEKNLSITVIFPMAGRGARFGYQFKPFLEILDKKFIQRAVESFTQNFNDIKEVIFIFLKEQEEQFKVTKTLKEMFPSIKHRSVILDKPTASHAETVRKGIIQGRIFGNIILCDCDHYLDTAPLFYYLRKSTAKDSCVIPLWKIQENEVASWAIVSVDKEMKALSIAEKKFPEKKGEYYGIIGCYYFNNAHDVVTGDKPSISDAIKLLLEKNELVRGVQIHKAEFFGDPARLQKTLGERE